MHSHYVTTTFFNNIFKTNLTTKIRNKIDRDIKSIEILIKVISRDRFSQEYTIIK